MLLKRLLLGLLLLPLGATAQRAIWTDDQHEPATGRLQAARTLRLYRPVAVQLGALRAALRSAPTGEPARRSAGSRTPDVVLSLPQPGGGTERFRVRQVAVMAPGLAARFPEIKTYQAWGIDDPSAVARLDVSPAGFHAQVQASGGRSYYLDPVSAGDTVHHRVFYKTDINMAAGAWHCGVRNKDTTADSGNRKTTKRGTAANEPVVLRTFRLAVACTPEYAQVKGNTLVKVLAAIVSTVNRVNGVYEKELAIRLVLVDGNDKLVFLNGTGPRANPVYSNSNGDAMLSQNQRNVDRLIGSANYDIGHVLSTGGGGVAYTPAVCDSEYKAGGVTGAPNPSGDAFDIDYVAHEMGHQFGANHTFNSTKELCDDGNRNPETAYEPGSGTSIMAYAGICSPENVQLNSDPYFHSVSYEEIRDYVEGEGSCGTSTTTANRPPVPEAGPAYYIPKSTPFVLTGSGTDPDGDALTYSWEEFDRGPENLINSPSGNDPIFRVFPPVVSPSRYFPRLADLVRNTQVLGEQLPTYGRRLHFRLAARDNRTGGGGLAYDSTSLGVVSAAGPFVVQTPNVNSVRWQAGAPAQVSWSVAGTTAAPISAAQVDILLSSDGGNTYPTVLLAATPNDGFENITLPLDLAATARARVMVRATGNVFFDISNADFTVVATPAPTFFLSPEAAATNTQLLVCPGASVATTLAVGALRGFTGDVALTTSSTLPAGISISFGSASVAAGSSTALTLSAAAGTAAGTYQLTLQGSSGSQTQTQTLTFTVRPAVTAAPALVAPTAAQLMPLRPYFSWNTVPVATSYELQLATNAAFTTGTANFPNLTGTSFGLAAPLSAGTTYFWRVRGLSDCGAGPYSTARTFSTSDETCSAMAASTGLPATLATTPNARLTSVLSVQPNGRVAEVRVRGLQLTAADVADFEITLTSPGGRSAVLLPRGTCPATANLQVSFDDLAGIAPTCATLNTDATVRPATSLHDLTLSTVSGNWTLTISGPAAASNSGATLTAWSLELCILNEPPPAPASLLAVRSPAGNATQVALSWSGEATAKATYYQLQRSFQANTSFADLAAAIASSPAAPALSYTDVVTENGRYYYRIRACNTTGCSAWTPEAQVLGTQTTSQLPDLTVVPNPSSGQFRVQLNNIQHGAILLSVRDVLGRELYVRALRKDMNTWQHSLELSSFSTGVYLLHLTLPDGTSTIKRLIKE
jgi:subtilisin-like proprotein convertase family protein